MFLSKFLCFLLFLSYHISAITPSSYESSKLLNQTTVSFTVTYDSNTDAVSYGTLIGNLRTALTGTSTPTLYGAFRVLPASNTVKDSARFVYVKLTNINNKSITLAIDVIDMYVVGYQTGTVSFFFNEYDIKQSPYSTLFTDTNPRSSLPFGGSYNQLIDAIKRASPGQQGIDRDTINLGIDELNYGIDSLSNTITTGSQDFRARPLLVLIQMVSEAARFGYIEREVQNLIRNFQSLPPSASTIDLENNWGTLSEAIQKAIDGRFQTPVVLFGQTFYSINAEIKETVTVLKYVSTSVNHIFSYGSVAES